MTFYKHVVLGGGLTAGYAAQELAKYAPSPHDIWILSAEDRLPYERPPLSKAFLAGDKTEAEILINEADFYQENNIEVLLNHKVEKVNFKKKELYVNGKTVNYEWLLIATGATPRTFTELPGANLDNIFYLRQVSDAKRIRQMAQEAEKAVVIGGSFIAMEVTAVLQSRGVDTTMIFPEKRVWQSFFTPEMSAFFESYYRDRGVTIMPGREVTEFLGDGQVRQVLTSRGDKVETDMVVAGIGVTPNSDLFKETGLQMEDGYVLVNRFLETNFPGVFAAGDITRYRDLIYDRVLHVEHWDNAVSQGQHAARMMMGNSDPYEHIPYFFSDEFDLSYEFWGDTSGAAKVVHRGDVEDGRFSTWWLDEDGRLLAAFVMDRPDEERKLAQDWIKSGKELKAEWLKETKTLSPKAEAVSS